MNFLARFIGGLGERVLAVALAVSAAQFPLYYLAYSNTLAGAAMEAEARYRELEQEAAQLQMTVGVFIERHDRNADDAFRASGRIHRNTVERYRRYSSMRAELQAAPLWRRPLALAGNFDREIHRETAFQPGLPLTLEGAAYALGGLLLAWLLAALLRLALGRPRAVPVH
jgi:hypothetical protein